jgi:hypothetical protein
MPVCKKQQKKSKTTATTPLGRSFTGLYYSSGFIACYSIQSEY